MLSPLQTLSGVQPSPSLQLGVVILLLLSLISRPRWLVLFLLVRDEGELRSSQLVVGVGLAHIPTLVLSMTGAQWRLHGWNEGDVVPLIV